MQHMYSKKCNERGRISASIKHSRVLIFLWHTHNTYTYGNKRIEERQKISQSPSKFLLYTYIPITKIGRRKTKVLSFEKKRMCILATCNTENESYVTLK